MNTEMVDQLLYESYCHIGRTRMSLLHACLIVNL